MPTALEIAQARQTRLSAGLLMSVQTTVPLFNAFDVRTTPDTQFLTLSMDSLPSSSFVRLNQGLSGGSAALSIRRASCALIGGTVEAPVQSSQLWDAAHGASGYTWFGLQADARIRADILNIERQMILGLANDTLGFPGANDITPFVSGSTVFIPTETAQKYQYKRTVLNVGSGVSLTSGTASSVYSFCFGMMDCQLVVGGVQAAPSQNAAQGLQGGELFQLTNISRQWIVPDPTNAPSAKLQVDIAGLFGHIGFSVSGFSPDQPGQTVPTQYSLRRAANITADTGAKLNDFFMEKLTTSHGPAKRPNLLAMSTRSGEQLAASRQPTAVNFLMGVSGRDAAAQTFTTYPERPDNYRGIPIVYPLCIGEADAIE